MPIPAPGSIDPVLQNIYDYTKFHIGLYATVFAAAAGAPKVLGLAHNHPSAWVLLAAMLMFLGAGVCGGKIASNIPDLQARLSASPIEGAGWPGWSTPLGRKTLKAWADAEHRFFWAGAAFCFIAVALMAIVTNQTT